MVLSSNFDRLEDLKHTLARNFQPRSDTNDDQLKRTIERLAKKRVQYLRAMQQLNDKDRLEARRDRIAASAAEQLT